MFVSSTYRTTGLQYNHRSPTLSAANVCKLFLQNYWVTLNLWVSNLHYNLYFLAPPTGLLGYTTLIGALSYTQDMFVCSTYNKINGCIKNTGAPPYMPAMFVTFTYRITELDYPYECRSLSAYVCKLYLLNNWFPLHLWIRHITCSLGFVRSINRITGLNYKYACTNFNCSLSF